MAKIVCMKELDKHSGDDIIQMTPRVDLMRFASVHHVAPSGVIEFFIILNEQPIIKCLFRFMAQQVAHLCQCIGCIDSCR